MKQVSILFFAFFLTVASAFPQARQAALDGTVSPGEYASSESFAGGRYTLSWRVDGDSAVFAMEAETGGWVAVGFDPRRAMAEADMVFGWIDGSGQLQIIDAYSLGPTGPHPSDESLGGTDDILDAAGREENGRTTIEFSRKLSSSDQYDKRIPADGTLAIIAAYSDSDNFNAFHRYATGGRITLGGSSAAAGPQPQTATGGNVPPARPGGQAGTAAADSGGGARSSLIIAHALLLSLGFALMTTGVAIARYYRRKRWWIKTHRPLGVAGAVLSILGFVVGFIMVSTSTGVHFRVLHSILGGITLIIIFATPILGQNVLTGKARKRTVRIIHRWSGRSALILMLTTIFLGMAQAGVL